MKYDYWVDPMYEKVCFLILETVTKSWTEDSGWLWNIIIDFSQINETFWLVLNRIWEFLWVWIIMFPHYFQWSILQYVCFKSGWWPFSFLKFTKNCILDIKLLSYHLSVKFFQKLKQNITKIYCGTVLSFQKSLQESFNFA